MISQKIKEIVLVYLVAIIVLVGTVTFINLSKTGITAITGFAVLNESNETINNETTINESVGIIEIATVDTSTNETTLATNETTKEKGKPEKAPKPGEPEKAELNAPPENVSVNATQNISLEKLSIPLVNETISQEEISATTLNEIEITKEENNTIPTADIKTFLECDTILYNKSLIYDDKGDIIETAWGLCLRNYTTKKLSVKQTLVFFDCQLNGTSSELCKTYKNTELTPNDVDLEENDLNCKLDGFTVMCGDVSCISRSNCDFYRSTTYANSEK